MRTRAIRPGFWEDDKMAKLPISARLTYVGLWCLADDAGYFVLRVPEIGAALFRYEPTRAREKRVQEAIAHLIELGRVKIESCGIHAVIPKLPEYRYNAGVLIFTVQKRHEKCTPSTLPLGLEIPKVEKARDISPSESSSESESESSTRKTAAPRGAGPTKANGHDRREGGSKDPDRRREEAIARARAKLEDPKSSENMKDAARFALQQMGLTP